jgi:Tol biopolymer transport system component
VRFFAKDRSARRTVSEVRSSATVHPARWSRPGAVLAFAAFLTVAVLLTAGAASAAAPTVTLTSADNPTYTTVDVHGSLDPGGEPSGWYFEISTDGENWQGAPGGGFFETPLSGPQPINETITGLTAGQKYFFRLVGYNEGGEARSGEPYPEATTESIPAPTVTIDQVTTFSGTTAHFSGRIEPNPPAGNPEAAEVNWHFQCQPECPGLTGGSVAAGAEGQDQIVEDEATGLEPNSEYVVRLVGKNTGEPVTAGPVTFRTATVGPEVQTIPAFAIRGGTEALVGGSINPRNSDTTYWIEYGTTSGYGHKFPAVPADAGSGGAPVLVTQRLAGLAPSTVYHFKLVAKSNAVTGAGVDQNFETAPSSEAIEQGCPNQDLRIENDSTALPDCRAYEQVSPTDKNGYDVGGTESGGFAEYSPFIAAEDGSRIAFESGAFGDSRSAFQLNTYLSTRGTSGWTTHALSPPLPPQISPSFMNVDWYSPDLHTAVIAPQAGYHLAPGDFPGVPNFYRLNTATDELTTLNIGDVPPGEHEFYQVIGASTDVKTVYFTSTEPLIEGASSPSIYEWNEGKLRLASLLPPNEGPGLEGNTHVSVDGSRLAFELDNQVYLREDGHTYELTPAGGYISGFDWATPDLSGIFVSTTAPLTSGSLNDGLGKIYRYNSGPKTWTPISPNPTDGGTAGKVVGASPDGSYVYFRSDSQYIPGQGIRGNSVVGTNLYLWHDGVITFIGTERNPRSEASGVTKFRVSPDGKRLSFESADRLTAYDNTDSTPGPGGASRADPEIYVYDAEAKRLTCVSCNPGGEPPSGTAGGPDAGSTLPAPAPRPPASRQAGVGDDGHIFFNTRDALVPEDVNGVQDVYEWRDGGPHLISSGSGADPAFYAGSSVDGNSVFFTTRQQLVRSDRDDLFDLYDARVDGGFALVEESSRCEGLDSCHGDESRPPVEVGLGTPGTAPQTRVDSARLRLKKTLRACNHRPKKKRAQCKAAARKKFKIASKGRAH